MHRKTKWSWHAWFAASVLGEGGIIVEGDGLAQRRFDPSEHQSVLFPHPTNVNSMA
jgi:hypothetical protein